MKIHNEQIFGVRRFFKQENNSSFFLPNTGHNTPQPNADK